MSKRALISVSDKEGIVEFAKALIELDFSIISTGGTAKLLRENAIAVQEVAELTGFPEMMDGRIKTLHPHIHGGLLGRQGTDEAVMQEHGIKPIDLLVVNLYPFEETVSKDNCSLEQAIEQIDIGGPTMLRAAAKNHNRVTVVVHPGDYDQVVEEFKQGGTQAATRLALATKVFEHTARYDGLIANYLGGLNQEQAAFPNTWNEQFIKKQSLRYGENPHQSAAFYRDVRNQYASVASAHQLQGKELSFNNIADADTALECVKSFVESPACVIVKHANPCGVALGDTILQAYERAYKTDPTSAFGGIIAFNGELDEVTANAIIERQFVEVIIAPSVSQAARKVLSAKPNVRLLSCGYWERPMGGYDIKRVNGGLLVQDRDLGQITRKDLKVVSKRQPSQQELDDLLFSWRVVKFVKSNAIVYCKDNMTIGIGAGQMSRVYSSKIAAIKAADEGLEVKGSVMASDAFFPFRDGIDAAAEAGITAVIEPGGSMRDEEVIQAADEFDMAMVFTGMRHFRH